jgi:cell division initiation protein
MKITPLEIRQKTFERTLRGYDKDEVNGFLLSLSQEWERTQDEVKELKTKFDASEREVVKHREVENTLYRTLKTAEDTGASVVEQATKSAELMLRESQIKSDSMVNEAKVKARNIIEEAEQTAKQIVAEMEDKLRGLADQYKTMELHRDNLLADLKRFASETMERVERQKRDKEFDPDKFLANAKREARAMVFPNEIERETKKALEQPIVKVEKVEEKKIVVPEPVLVETKTPSIPSSPKNFFDDIQ